MVVASPETAADLLTQDNEEEVEVTAHEPEIIEVFGVPEEAGERVKELVQADADKRLRVEAVLEDAADPDSPLHRFFEWDRDEAAAKYRWGQAEALIRRIRVKILMSPDKPPITARAYISQRDVPSSKGTTGTYLPIQHISRSPVYEAELRNSMKRDLQRVMKKYKDMETLMDVWTEVIEEVEAAAAAEAEAAAEAAAEEVALDA